MSINTQRRKLEIKKLMKEKYTPREISSSIGISYATVLKYKKEIDAEEKQGNAIKTSERKALTSKNNDKNIEINNEIEKVHNEKDDLIIIQDNEVKSFSILIRFLENEYTIRGYEIYDGTVFNYEDITTAIYLEGYSVKSIRYGIFNATKVIDRITLIDIANQISDCAFLSCVKDIIFNKNVLDEYYDILNSFYTLDESINKLSEKYEKIATFNKIQQDILHDIEDVSIHKTERKLELLDNLRSLRVERRVVSNDIALARSFKHYLANARAHSRQLVEIADKIMPNLKDLAQGKYYSRLTDDDNNSNLESEQE